MCVCVCGLRERANRGGAGTGPAASMYAMRWTRAIAAEQRTIIADADGSVGERRAVHSLAGTEHSRAIGQATAGCGLWARGPWRGAVGSGSGGRKGRRGAGAFLHFGYGLCYNFSLYSRESYLRGDWAHASATTTIIPPPPRTLTRQREQSPDCTTRECRHAAEQRYRLP